MVRRQRRSWKIFSFAAVIGLTVGVLYYVAMVALRGESGSRAPIMLLPTDSGLAQPLPVATLAAGVEYPRLSIPTAGISASVVQLQITGNSWGVYGLGMNIGHLVGTSPLMSRGNIVLVGHVEMADGSPGVFATIASMKGGERIFVNWRGEQREYDVATIRSVSPDDVSVLYPTDHEQLTLITCDDYDFLTNTYRQRIVATAPRVT